jgi:hypothetical protein
MITKYISVQNHKTNITKQKKLNKKMNYIDLIPTISLFLPSGITNIFLIEISERSLNERSY